jgi:hypothetical protein
MFTCNGPAVQKSGNDAGPSASILVLSSPRSHLNRSDHFLKHNQRQENINRMETRLTEGFNMLYPWEHDEITQVTHSWS